MSHLQIRLEKSPCRHKGPGLILSFCIGDIYLQRYERLPFKHYFMLTADELIVDGVVFYTFSSEAAGQYVLSWLPGMLASAPLHGQRKRKAESSDEDDENPYDYLDDE